MALTSFALFASIGLAQMAILLIILLVVFWFFAPTILSILATAVGWLISLLLLPIPKLRKEFRSIANERTAIGKKYKKAFS